MNKKQRDRNRATARTLRMTVGVEETCPRCGQRTFTGHYSASFFGVPGVWVCQLPAEAKASLLSAMREAA
jgi:hypothetical protein